MTPHAPRRARAVLYVEDDPHHATLVMRSLAELLGGAHLVHVQDGEAALRYVESAEGDARPVLVLLDLRLPKLGGLEVLAALKGNPSHASIPVVVLSTSESQRDVSRAYAAHANSYLVKPAELEVLEQQLRDLSRYWLGWNVPSATAHGAT